MSDYKPVLDPCCGGRMFWFDKENPAVLFCDNRKFTGELCDGRSYEVKPDVTCDFTSLPFDNNSFYHVVFDPPHLIHVGDNAWMAKKYGKLPADWQDYLRKGFDECFRVLKSYGTLVFKWSETDISVKDILALAPAQPLYGHKSGKLNKTHWFCFMKMPENRSKWLDELLEDRQ